MGFHRRSIFLVLLSVVLATAALAGWGAGTVTSSDPPQEALRGAVPREGTIETRLAALERSSLHQRRAAYYARVREAVVRGAAHDFATGTGIGGPRSRVV